MPNGVHKSNEFESNEFEASTRVMESGLLRVLTDESSGEADEGTDASSSASPQIDIVVAEPVVEQFAVTRSEPQPPTALAATPTASAGPAVPPKAAPEPPRRGSRLFVVAGVVAALVLAFDTSLFLSHQRRAAPAIAAPSAPDPMPRYRVLPLRAPPAPVEEAQAEEPPAATPPTAVVAAAVPVSSEAAVRSHGHSRHRHGRH